MGVSEELGAHSASRIHSGPFFDSLTSGDSHWGTALLRISDCVCGAAVENALSKKTRRSMGRS